MLLNVKIESYYRESDDAAIERSQRWKELGSVGNEATHDPPLSRLARLREAPASIRRVRSQGRGTGEGQRRLRGEGGAR